MGAANCVRFDLNCFCHEVNNLHVPQNKKDTQFAARMSLDMKLKDQSRALHSPFFTISHYKSTKMENLRFLGNFFQPPYTELERAS